MKKMLKKKTLLVLPLVLGLLLAPSLLRPAQVALAAFPPVLSVSHSPSTVYYQTNVTVMVTFTDDTNVSSILVQYCALEPEFLCHFPKITMIRVSPNTWQGAFVVQEESGVIGYELQITFNGQLYLAPNASDFLGHSNIVEASPGVFYFSIDLNQETKTSPFGANPLLIGFVFLAILIYRKRR